MARPSRRRSRRQSSAPAVAIHQIDRKLLRNRFAPIEALDEEQLEFIHDISLRIVEEAGGKVARVLFIVDRGEGAAEAFAEHGVTLETIFGRGDLPV